ncbi:TPA: hypothetical protein N0F65_000667 [Lagenidium giganteum]|uniref:Uncharacterized protein n=1 Tax=Lagenidium giganteum TaxID=4803 RepID=A0AAV2YU31_9STRA|nr:TPA: hypothetical protein N0F65_000667 [Lagenidium giganteum]
MIHTVMKSGTTCATMAKLVRMKTPTFEKMIVGFLRVVFPLLYDNQVTAESY